MSTAPQPLKIQRLAALFLSFAFAVVGLGVSINARVKANQVLKQVYDAAPQGTVVNVDTKDISDVGIVVLTGCALQVALSALFTVFVFIPRRTTALFLRIQGWLLYFCGLWLLATLIPFDVIFATRQANVTATLNGIPVPASEVQNMEEALGLSPYYKDAWYLKLVAILPWFAFPFAVLAGFVLQFAAGQITFGSSQNNEKEP
ncbi:hypothetical protein BKA82DRAFT_126293 [Pisolithus tinctorius]|uniref:Uncharacterized protein n=1 Tax=Pisolithus tinctorius Marx 270 TaxID=870435 RepID=A0A0C3PT40_PISTI|nr:hypothetical protein BKA82DRAFT_126293 [Pisolithus tinctorius]KIO11844.1 hypothetical protein M404DRAFT_126293 [Pisolithus tinctorius Marx 270]